MYSCTYALMSMKTAVVSAGIPALQKRPRNFLWLFCRHAIATTTLLINAKHKIPNTMGTSFVLPDM